MSAGIVHGLLGQKILCLNGHLRICMANLVTRPSRCKNNTNEYNSNACTVLPDQHECTQQNAHFPDDELREQDWAVSGLNKWTRRLPRQQKEHSPVRPAFGR